MGKTMNEYHLTYASVSFSSFQLVDAYRKRTVNLKTAIVMHFLEMFGPANVLLTSI